MQHPPFCPKTQETFRSRDGAVSWSDGCGWVGADGLPIGSPDDLELESPYPDECRFLARYQACAWQDRADRWDAVACRTDNDDYRWRAAADELHRCEDIARAWREWEREETT